MEWHQKPKLAKTWSTVYTPGGMFTQVPELLNPVDRSYKHQTSFKEDRKDTFYKSTAASRYKEAATVKASWKNSREERKKSFTSSFLDTSIKLDKSPPTKDAKVKKY